MNTPFRINFRREAFRRQRTDSRRRALLLGVWLAYFGVLAVTLGLYALNWNELASRTRQLSHQIERQRLAHAAGADWKPAATDAGLAGPWVNDVARWRDLLVRLPTLMPEGVRITNLRFNPDGVMGGERKLLLSGVLRMRGDRDRIGGVTDFVTVVSRDSVFASHFRSVRLLSTNTREGEPDALFELECR
jgi:hypothetical protein